ncbi:hypothetical protein HQ496_13500 [bacterium]|nr:hypothetical protein [bacterium]
MMLDFRLRLSAFAAPLVALPERQRHVRRNLLHSLLMVTSLLLWGMGCATSEEESNVLILNASDSLLVDVLIDLHAIDANLYTNQMHRMKRDEPIAFDFSDKGPRDSVLAIHGLDSTSFNQLIEEHLEHPDRFLMVYNRVLDKSASQ